MIEINTENESLSGQVFLRPAERPRDEDFLTALYGSTRDDINGLPLGEEQKNSLLRLQYESQRRSYEIQYPDMVHYLVLVGSTPVGRYMVENRPDDILAIDLALLPEFRSRGIGAAILKSSMAEAAKINRPFILHVLKTNRAIELYLRIGCVITGETGTHFEMTSYPPAVSESSPE